MKISPEYNENFKEWKNVTNIQNQTLKTHANWYTIDLFNKEVVDEKDENNKNALNEV